MSRLFFIWMRKLKSFIKRIGIFDIFLIGILIVLFASFFLFFYRKVEAISIRVKVTDIDILYASTNPQTWYADRFQVGDTERDALGRVVSEIVGIESFNINSNTKVLYLDLKIRAVYDKKSRMYSAKGKNLVFGSPIRFNLSRVTFDGIVTDSPSIKMQKNLKVFDTQVKALIRGGEPLILQSVKKGDKALDSKGNIMVEVIDVKIRPAEKVTQTDRGELLLRYDPLFKDAIYTLNIRTRVFDKEPFMFDNIPLKLGETVPLNFEQVSLFPLIVEILP